MNIVSVNSISKAYGQQIILKDASFYLQEGDKIGIIGINGTGKSTLIRMLCGEEYPDNGDIVFANNYTIAYLPQNPYFDPDDSVLEATVKYTEKYGNSWDIEVEAKQIKTKLGITDFNEKCGHLSGGQKKRLALVGVLLSNADILLLDEPTNHLDGEMSTWLEKKLSSYSGSIIMVTHDRYFLDLVTNRIIEIDKGNIYSYDENYEGYLEKKALRESVLDAGQRKRQSILRNELEWVRRGARARSTKQKARLERFEELKNKEDIVKDSSVVLGSVASRLGNTTVSLEHISKVYDGVTYINDFSYNFLKNDRVGIIGKNGCGKSTLLKIIQEFITPDAGFVEVGKTVRFGYFSQETNMDPNQRVIDYIRDEAEFVDTVDGKISATRLLENFLFKGENQYGLVGKLSGGEKRRLYLCRILMSAPNVLVLDEPTNDLDITTLTILEDYLDRFLGIVIVVSHDRYFLDRVVNRIFAFNSDGTLMQSEGGYTDYELRIQDYEKEKNEQFQSGKIKSEKNKETDWKKHDTKLKFSYKEQREYETIEEDIRKLEEEINSLEEKLLQNSRDFVKLQEISAQKEKCEQRLSEKMDRWVYLEELADKIAAGHHK